MKHNEKTTKTKNKRHFINQPVNISTATKYLLKQLQLNSTEKGEQGGVGGWIGKTNAENQFCK